MSIFLDWGRKLRLAFVALLTMGLVAGCTTSGGGTTGQGALTGGVIGAGLGGLAGAAVGGTRGAVIGAVGGGILGAIIGDQLERQEIERQQLAALRTGRMTARRIQNSEGRNVAIRTTVRTYRNPSNSALSCREAVSTRDGQQVASNSRCQVRQANGAVTWET